MHLPSLNSFQEEFLSGKPLKKEYIHFSELNCHDLDVWIGRICRTVSLEFLHEILFTILNELLVNGCKANAKRVFFQSRSLDINSLADYQKGIPYFKNEFGHHRMQIFSELEKSNYFVNVTAQNFPNFVEFSITNNAKILDEEKNRIQTRITASEKYKNINDAYKESIDSEESSGLGIVLIHILLRNSGIKNQFFELATDEKETSVLIRIPKLLIPLDSQNKIRNLLIKEVEGLPPLAPQIQTLILEARNKDMDWLHLAKNVQKEPAITAEILKISNSPLFGAHTKVIVISDALKRIGIRNLESIFLALGARKILNSRYTKQISVWSHSIKTSVFARYLGEESHHFLKYAEIASIGGLLHDLGRMILLSLDLSLIEQIRILRNEDSTGISEWVEEYSLGITHSDIGYLIAKKWNFPDEILDVIKYHHKPWQCKSKNYPLCQMVYLSDILASTGRGKGNYYTVEPEILSAFGIEDEHRFQEILTKFKEKYEKQKEEYEGLLL
jgi:HD-like signal output (HDOD) protein